MAKSFIDVVQDSPRMGLGIPVKTKTLSLEPKHHSRNRLSALNFTGGSSVRPELPSAATRLFGRPTSRANLGRNKKISPPVDADSQVRTGRGLAMTVLFFSVAEGEGKEICT